ncbi:DUF58 domain-containing protein [uncultured Thermanaerothrix sp.]|uniref:DUF58 domain-containing protein n=1 Tax=uncultured Thermanaerothrix sp. TaxID=1195149 RepID=UPI002621CA29|nr:DUF58 domain-containing protein [uncultured Thermanaerothrix sp.]
MKFRVWATLIIGVILVGTLVRVQWLVGLGLATGAVVGMTYLWQQWALERVVYHRHLIYSRGFPGETLPLRLSVENQKRLPLTWLRVRDSWPLNLSPQEGEVMAPSHVPGRGYLTNVYHLWGYRRVIRDLHLRLGARGIYTLGPVILESGDPFGLAEQHEERELPATVTVFPELESRTSLGLLSEDPYGERGTRKRLFEDPNLTIGVRPYMPEDTFRQIHWPATVRTGQLQTRVYQPIVSQVMMLCVNVATSEHPWLGTLPEVLERIIRVAASFCYYGIEDGYAVGLAVNGGVTSSDQFMQVQPGRTMDHLAMLLQALAGVTPLITHPFERFLVHTASHVSMGATLVILTALVNPPLLEAITLIQRYRHHLVLVALSETPPPSLPRVKVIHLPVAGEAKDI